jgi:TPR repeat protein
MSDIRRCAIAVTVLAVCGCSGEREPAEVKQAAVASGGARATGRFAEERTAAEKRCRAGQVEFCHALAEMLRSGKGGPRDLDRALELQLAACGRDHAASCAEVGVHFSNPHLGPVDVARAREYHGRGCDGGWGRCCELLARSWLKETFGQTDPPKARAAFARARAAYRVQCDGGDGDACRWLANLWKKGEGGAVDLERAELYGARARDAYSARCDAGDGHICRVIAAVYENGEGVPVDRERSSKLYAKARIALARDCAEGDPASCFFLGHLWQNGKGGPKDAARAEEYARLGCAGGFGVGCN